MILKTREELLNEMDKFRWTLTSGQSKVLKSGLHQILAAPTEKQTKCEYCHKEKAIKLSENYYLEIAPPDDANLVGKRSFDYRDWQIGTTKFNYCPHCGRKLGDE